MSPVWTESPVGYTYKRLCVCVFVRHVCHWQLVCLLLFRVIELQAKLDDQMSERRSLADSASSPIDDELRDICNTSFSSDRAPAFRPSLPLPPPPPPHAFGYRPSPVFMPPFYSRRPPPPDRLHSPPAFDAYRGDTYVRESPRPRDISPPGGRRPVASQHQRSAPPFDNFGEEAYMGRSPPPRGTSPPYYERHDRRRSPPTFDGHRHDERYGRHSPPRERGKSPPQRYRNSRRDRSRTPDDEERSAMPSNNSHMRSHVPPREEKYQQSRYTSERNTGIPDGRPPMVRSPPTLQSPLDDDDYPTYWHQVTFLLLFFSEALHQCSALIYMLWCQIYSPGVFHINI